MKLSRTFGLAALATLVAFSTTDLFASEAFAADKPAVKAPAKPNDQLTAEEILQKAGSSLFPDQFTAKIEMVQYKPGAPESSSEMMLYKRGVDQVRADYTKPSQQAGQKMLRKEGQIWMYMADIKRPIKMNAKTSLGGSDFNNGDIMRLNLAEDYTPTIASQDDKVWVLDLKAKNNTVTYDVIKYTIEKKDLRSVKQEFFTLSGKQIKTLEFQEYRDYGGLKRPSLFVMKSSLASGVYTTMKYTQFEAGKTLDASQFRPDALAKQ